MADFKENKRQAEDGSVLVIRRLASSGTLERTFFCICDRVLPEDGGKMHSMGKGE